MQGWTMRPALQNDFKNVPTYEGLHICDTQDEPYHDPEITRCRTGRF
jgi:hypothetical protein